MTVRAAGYVPRDEALDARDDTHSIALEPGWTLDGNVVDTNGSPVGSGFAVLALGTGPSGITPTVCRKLRQGHPSLLLGMTDGSGRFAIDGLERGQAYTVIGGAPGLLVDPDEAPRVTEGTQEVVLIAYRIAGLRLELTSADGAPFQGSGQYTLSLAEGIRLDSYEGLAEIDLRQEFLALARIGDDSPHCDRTCRTFLALYPEGGTLPAGSGSVDVPGYLPAELRFQLQPVLDDVPEHELLLRPMAGGWGRVGIRFSRGESPSDAVFEVTLTPADRSGRSRTYLVGASDSYLLQGVPYGRYLASVRSRASSTALAVDQEILVGDADRSIVVDLGQTGAVELEVVRDDGPYRGELSVLVVEDDGRGEPSSFTGRGGHMSFNGAPYLVECLKAGGTYLVYPVSPLHARDEVTGAPFGKCVVRSGQREVLRFLAD